MCMYKYMHQPEFESGSTAWKAVILTTILQMLYVYMDISLNLYYLFYN